MMYVNKQLLNKRLPAYVGVFILLLTLTTTILLSRNTLLFVTKATVGSEPKEMKISNVTNTSFTVTYLTDQTVTGNIAYGNQTSLGQIGFDDRDAQAAKPAEYKTHSITITQLNPATKYFFTIASGTQVSTNNGAPFEVTTGPAVNNPPVNNSALSGTVTLDDGTIPTEGVVSASTDNSQLLTTQLKPDGSYTIPLNQLRSNDLQSYLLLNSASKIQLHISTPTQESLVQVAATQVSTVPKIVLGNNYDFTLSPDPLASTTASESAKIASGSAGFPTNNAPVTVNSPEITSPQVNQKLKDAQPLFKGRALPNADIEITINSQKEISAKLQSDNTGAWEFRSPIALEPGTHTITIASVDASGVMQQITRSFTVNAAGSQFIEPSVSPTQAPPVTPTIAALPSPTVAPTATPSPTLLPSPSVNTTPQPSPVTVKPTGSSIISMSIIGAITAIGIGTLIFVLTAI